MVYQLFRKLGMEESLRRKPKGRRQTTLRLPAHMSTTESGNVDQKAGQLTEKPVGLHHLDGVTVAH
jgi:hypothetical protein